MKQRILLLTFIVGMILMGAATSEVYAVSKIDKLKCAFLLNFSKYVSWPATTGDAFIIGVVGDDPFDGVLDQIVKGKSVGAQPIKTQYFSAGASADDLTKCSILFIVVDPEPIVKKVAGSSVLTVSDKAGFAKSHGMIGLIATNKISLEINNNKAKDANLKINAKLLKMSTIIE